MTFQHTAARRRLIWCVVAFEQIFGFNTQPPEGGWHGFRRAATRYFVSTHSRPKAAESRDFAECWIAQFQHTAARRRLTQSINGIVANCAFQHTAARRRLIDQTNNHRLPNIVSTHSRPKAAEYTTSRTSYSTSVSTHSRPKAADQSHLPPNQNRCLFQHTAARRRLNTPLLIVPVTLRFQHTAARRRLKNQHATWLIYQWVSTHSRPKAAEPNLPRPPRNLAVSTHSRPKAADIRHTK